MRILIVLLTVLFTSTVFATEAIPDVESLQQFASLIRWSGVFFSMVIVFATWLLLRFIDSVVENVSNQFVQYRMVLQKAQSFFQFFMYVSSGLIVFMISFRINDHILALIGGTLAVSVGFALKDLA